MESTSGSAIRFACAGHDPDWRATKQDAALGPARTRTTTRTVDADGIAVCTLVEERQNERVRFRRVEHLLKFITEETYDENGQVISSEKVRYERDGSKTVIRTFGEGKSQTTRIQSGSIEVRATERMVMIETPHANYKYMPFEGTWSAYYKEGRMTLNMESSFLRSPNGVIFGPDGFGLVFANSRLVDFTPGVRGVEPVASPEQ